MEYVVDTFLDFDANHDDFHSRGEFRRAYSHLFGAALAPAKAEEAFRTLDVNRDGRLSQSEFEALAK